MCLDCEHLSLNLCIFPGHPICAGMKNNARQICAACAICQVHIEWQANYCSLLLLLLLLGRDWILSFSAFLVQNLKCWTSIMFVLAGTCSLECGNKLLKFTHVMIVVGIVRNMSNMGLKGTLPPELGELSYLEFLDLSNNRISGTIPSFFANLTYLANLWGQVPYLLLGWP